jgi:hypothetical protein
MHRCAEGLWLQGHTARASLLCSVGKIFHCVHYLSAAPRKCATANLQRRTGTRHPWNGIFETSGFALLSRVSIAVAASVTLIILVHPKTEYFISLKYILVFCDDGHILYLYYLTFGLFKHTLNYSLR